MQRDDTFPTYQAEQQALAVYPGQGSNIGLFYAVLGLAGEAGEVANKVKKLLRDGVTPEAQDAIRAELGDVLWYVSAISSENGWSLADIAEENIDKLRSREARGTLRGEGDAR